MAIGFIEKGMQYVIVLCYLVFGTFFIYFLISGILHNIIGKTFEYKTIPAKSYHIIEDANDIKLVEYEYEVDDKLFHNKIRIDSELLSQAIQNSDLLISYNTIFPSVSNLQSFKLANMHYITLGFSSFVLLLTALLSLQPIKQFWIKKYKHFLKN